MKDASKSKTNKKIVTLVKPQTKTSKPSVNMQKVTSEKKLK